MLYLVDSQDALVDAMQIIPLSNSAIVDLSGYAEDVAAAARRIDEAAAGVPTTLLVTEVQRPVLASLSDLRCRVFSIDADAVDPLQQFSAVGYPAVYLDLIERQVRFSTVYRQGRYSRIAALKSRFATFYRRATTVMKYVRWRLGGREF